DETLLAKGKVRYIGEPVAAVAATTRQAAEQAARLIVVDYDPLPPVLNIDEALADGAPIVHEEFDTYFKRVQDLDVSGNECWSCSIEEGDVDAAWQDCAAIVEGAFETQAQHHLYLEPSSALADVDRNGKLTIWGPSQGVHYIQHRTADVLGLPLTKVRAISPTVGGGFGGRAGPHVQPIAAALALAARRPVKVTLSRVTDFETCRSRHPSRIAMKIGARSDGALVAQTAEFVFDGGAFADESPAVTSFGVMMARGPYRVPNLRIAGRAVYTNKLRAGSFRGFGNPQATFARESLLDELAAKLDMEPIDLRLKNALVAGEKWAGGQNVPACGFKECLEQVKAAVAGDAKSGPPASPGKRRGVGISGFAHISSFLASGATVQLREDGTISLDTGAVDIGQGSNTILAQICAEALKVPADHVSIATVDTDTSPYNYKSVGSRTTYTTGRAVKAAADAVAAEILVHAAAMLGCEPEQAALLPGGVIGVSAVEEGSPLINKTVSFEDVAGRSHYAVGGPIVATNTFVYDGSPFDREGSRMKGIAFGNMGAYIFGAQAVEVDVDETTGQVTVQRAWAASDVGQAVNPTNVEGQIQGGLVQGLGYALFEEMVWEDGRLINPSMMDYKAPGALDAPAEITAIIVEDPEPTGPFGAKGVGEPAMVGVAPAVANAVASAADVRLRRLPMTPERVLGKLMGGDGTEGG
ncbi:MAG: xanthine dehydrogenase family protein molybdopterin-binding subunit, partial [Alphaproteobacteria bacterium]|nr:xanthine dehydrogenase family protein molybdopterin-binding subunit [Alphaproteobacteria bacterium]